MALRVEHRAGVIASLLDVWRKGRAPERYPHFLSDGGVERAIDFQGCGIELLHRCINRLSNRQAAKGAKEKSLYSIAVRKSSDYYREAVA